MAMLNNVSKKTIIVKEHELCSSVLSKAIGLMFSRPINDRCLIFDFLVPRRIDLHMFFVFYPIDVLFLDEHRKIVEIKKKFRPFWVYLSKRKAKYCIELPCGALKRSNTDIGDTVVWD